MPKSRVYLLGFITLLIFPLPALAALWYFVGKNPWEIMEFDQLLQPIQLIGLSFGMTYAVVCLYLFQLPVFENELDKQERLIASMNLKLIDKIFLSFCAGFGEEILFRAGVQHGLGIWVTSILFVAIHGYLNPKNWRLSLYGLALLPFIVCLGYAYNTFGLWFCIAAHFSYDLMIFLSIQPEENEIKRSDFFNS